MFNPESVLKNLKTDGYALIENFLEGNFQPVLQEFDRAFGLIPDKSHATLNDTQNLTLQPKEKVYNPGKHLNVQPGGYALFPTLLSHFANQVFQNIVNEYCGPRSQFLYQIFMSHEYHTVPNQKDWSRLNWLHFDPYPSLKFLLYLTDTDEGNGATMVVPGSRAIGKYYREKRLDINDNSGWQGGCKHRLEDWEETPQYTNADAVPLCVKAGTLLLVDTDVLHCGALLHEEGRERKLILVHNRPEGLRMPDHEPPYDPVFVAHQYIAKAHSILRSIHG
ncbi:MAG: phytanoyl-CoA dioxygenase family protein [Bdellovibrionales bacterium]|nr:phytanoyl-CoA dioxygenase family protein [Bdellovibrionales bacterium]